jgi:hypothetical protein
MRRQHMRNRCSNIGVSIVMIAIMTLAPVSLFGQQKLAQTGFQWLSVVSDARAAALGETMTSLQVGSSAMFFNPAGMSDMRGLISVSGSSNEWIADINHYTLALAVKPARGNYGVFGLSFQSVDYGEFIGTRVHPGIEQGYIDTGIFKLTSYALGLGYARQLSDRFSVGGHARYLSQDLGESMIATNIRRIDEDTWEADTSFVSNKLAPFVFDFGTQYRTGFRSLVFGMSVRNFSREVSYAEEGMQAPLVFTLGISMDMMDFAHESSFEQSLILSVDASHHRDHPQQVKVGLDYRLMNTLSLRIGYIANNFEDDISYGLGLSQFGFDFDYSYTPFGVWGSVQRLTFRFSY